MAESDRDPGALRRTIAARLGRTREVVTALAEQHNLPTENLISPSLVRSLAWEPPEPLTLAAVAASLTDQGARPWQIGLTAELLTQALEPAPAEPETGDSTI